MDTRIYSIRYWPTWLGLGVLWSMTHLPYTWQIAIGRLLGAAARRFATRRREIAEVNFALCFPQLTAEAREKLLREHFSALGIAIMESAMSWWASNEMLRKRVQVDGLQHLEDALQAGKGVILLSAHFTTLEIGGRLLSIFAPFDAMYRKHKNPVIEHVMHKSRTRSIELAIPRKDMRTMLRSLKRNMPVWYAPDQDYGAKHSIFAPFFGVQAASITATSRIARTSGAAVVPFFQTRLPDNRGYQLTLYPALEDFPGESIEQDTLRINALIEARIREQPAQYLWVHRRFKTRPPGEEKFYKPRRRKRR